MSKVAPEQTKRQYRKHFKMTDDSKLEVLQAHDKSLIIGSYLDWKYLDPFMWFRFYVSGKIEQRICWGGDSSESVREVTIDES